MLVLALWLACATPEPDPGAGDAEPDPDAALAAEVARLRAAEADVVRRELDLALEAGALARAVEAAGHAGPEAVARVAALARSLPPAEAAPLLRALVAHNPSLRAEAEAAEVQARHLGPVPRWAGVRLRHGVAALEVIDERYVVAPDWAKLASAGDARLRLVPGVRPVPDAPVARRQDAEARLARWVAEGGLAEEVVVGEWIEGAVAALDPYTRAVWPAEVAGWEAHHAGTYVGVGLELADREGARVRWPVPGSPAFAAGVHQDDLVVAVDGTPVATAAEAGERLRGEAGSVARVEFRRGDEPLVFELTRAPITPDTVVGWTRTADHGWDVWLDQADGIAYARLLAFRPGTEEAFDALFAPIADGVRAIVLDLRGCAGGDLDAAVQLVDRFVADGTLLTLEGRIPPPPPPEGVVPWNAAVPGHAFEAVPIAVLVDGETASSAEVVAGSLRAHGRAVLVGERTFGKGSSQALVALEGRVGDDGVVEPLGSAVQVTNFRWVLPDGRAIEGVGVAPDEPLPLGSAGRWQVRAARARLEHVRAHADGTPLRIDVPAPRPDLPVLSADPHVHRALSTLRARLDVTDRLGDG